MRTKDTFREGMWVYRIKDDRGSTIISRRIYEIQTLPDDGLGIVLVRNLNDITYTAVVDYDEIMPSFFQQGMKLKYKNTTCWFSVLSVRVAAGAQFITFSRIGLGGEVTYKPEGVEMECGELTDFFYY